MSFLDKFKFKKKTVKAPETQDPGQDTQGPLAIEGSVPAHVKEKTKIWDGLGSKFERVVSGASPTKLATIAGTAIAVVFLVHIGVEAYMSHVAYVAERKRIDERTVKQLAGSEHLKLPSITLSGENVYLGLGRLSEFTKMTVLFPEKQNDTSGLIQKTKNADNFQVWARPLSIVKGLYTGPVMVVVHEPISTSIIVLPFIQELFMRNNGIITSIDFLKGSRRGANAGAKLLVSGEIYGSAPQKAIPPLKSEGIPR